MRTSSEWEEIGLKKWCLEKALQDNALVGESEIAKANEFYQWLIEEKEEKETNE